jgi:hypothetical protein
MTQRVIKRVTAMRSLGAEPARKLSRVNPMNRRVNDPTAMQVPANLKRAAADVAAGEAVVAADEDVIRVPRTQQAVTPVHVVLQKPVPNHATTFNCVPMNRLGPKSMTKMICRSMMI